MQVVTVLGSKNKIDIFSVYNPNKIVQSAEFIHYFNQLNDEKIIVGDFNAHNPMWDSHSIINTTGNNLVDAMITSPNLCLLTPKNFPTHYNIPTKKFSTLDLCLISTNLYLSSTIELQRDLGSDHTPSLITVTFGLPVVQLATRRRWLFDKGGEWDEWRKKLPIVQVNNNTLQTNYKNFEQSLISTSNEEFSLSQKNTNTKISTPWWNQDIAKLVKIRHHAKNIFQKHPTPLNLSSLRKAELNVKKKTKEAKRNSFRNFCSSINSSTPNKVVWNYIGRLSNKHQPKQALTLVKDDIIYTDSQEKANIMAQHFEKILNENSHQST